MLRWHEMGMMGEEIPAAALPTVLKLRQQSLTSHFMMKLRLDFKPVWATILTRGGEFNLKIFLPELLAEETRIKSKTSHQLVQDAALLVTAQKGKSRDISKVECFTCHEMVHIASHCPKGKPTKILFCRYCKSEGHLIENCHIRPPKNHNHKAFVAALPPTGAVAGPVLASRA